MTALSVKDRILRIEIGILDWYSTDGYIRSIHDYAGDPIDLSMWAKKIGVEYDLKLTNGHLEITLALAP